MMVLLEAVSLAASNFLYGCLFFLLHCQQLPPMKIPAAYLWLCIVITLGCSKGSSSDPVPLPPRPLRLVTAEVDGVTLAGNIGVLLQPSLKLVFSAPVDEASAAGITLKDKQGTDVNVSKTWSGTDSILSIKPANNLPALTGYTLSIPTTLKSRAGGALNLAYNESFTTGIDSTIKFPVLTDDALMTLVQRQTFKYFWDFAHPVSGLARERNTSDQTVTSGGSGFGLMSVVVGVHRGFVSRAEALQRLQTIITFLTNKAQRFHGAFPHWLNGTTGAVIPFSSTDDGADLVETSFLAMGLIAVREYFDQGNSSETKLRGDINAILEGIEWDWFRQGSQQVLYWHWSPNNGWAMNLKIAGWNECLVTYVLAAGAQNDTIPETVYQSGFARDGQMVNGNVYYNTTLPLGPAMGGPLFFSHYSFLGIDPRGLKDKYADYWNQNLAHTTINRLYCVSNPRNYYGYSTAVWGLTASDIPDGYTASSPSNDRGVIAPTAAISSMPYTPVESMKSMRFMYEVLGDKVWKNYGFVDAFSLHHNWFASSFLAIDQGPQIVMIENHRSSLIWNLCSKAPEVQQGLKKLGFTSPYL